MKIFVIKGNIRGLVKIDRIIHLVGDDFDKISTIILYDNKNIKIVKKNELNLVDVNFNCKSVVLLDSTNNLLGSGSIAGKADINKILIEYNKLIRNNGFENFADEKLKNSSKIDTKSHNNDKIVNPKDKVDNESNIKNPNKSIAEENKINLDIGKMQKEKNIANYQESSCAVERNIADFEVEKENLTNKTQAVKSADYGNNADRMSEIMQKDDLQVYGNNLNNNNGCLQEVYLNKTANKQNEKTEVEQEILLKQKDKIDTGMNFILENFEDKCVQKNNFYSEIKENLEKFLNQHPKNEELESKVWGSKWVKIKADYDYSVGVIFEENTPSIIAYAIPYDDYNQIDKDKLSYCEWLQIEEKTNKNRGYLVYYQNAQTGEMLLG